MTVSRWLILFGTAIWSNALLAQMVFWGGVSFAGWESRDALYPNVASFLCSGSDCPEQTIDTWALKAINDAQFDAFTVSMDYISGSAIEGVIMTPMITGESFSMVEDITDDKASCAIWTPLVNVTLDGGGVIDGQGHAWWWASDAVCDAKSNDRSCTAIPGT